MFNRNQLSISLLLLAFCALPAMASVTVNSPADGSTVTPQFNLSAAATTCSSQPVVAMAFSLDSSSNNTIVMSTAINATVTATTGTHTLHVKAWGNGGAVCVTDVALNVSATLTGVSVTTPASGATVATSFTLNADAVTCSSQPVVAMGYSFDYGATTFVYASVTNTSVSTTTGSHILHVKAWGNAGAVCVSDVPITVTAAAANNTSSILNGVTVTSPASNSNVSSPFSLSASSSTCSSQTVVAMGYSLDNSSSTAIVMNNSVAASVTATPGAHTLHVKAWGNAGSVCVNDVAITVASTGSSLAATTSDLAISSPASGATVASPFTLAASATNCSSQAISSIGYALDSSSANIVSGSAINTQVAAAPGQHTLTVTAYGASGSQCTSTATVTIPPPASLVPSNAITVSSIQTLNNWITNYDTGTNGGGATGAMQIVGSPSLSGSARSFYTTFSNYGGELYYSAFAEDTNALNFLYDVWIYLDNSSGSIGNVEMDLNQVMANGQTVIFGFQCDGYSSTWDYTSNLGTPTNSIDHWNHSAASCNPRNWTTNTWHHVQVSYSRDDYGNATYNSVWFDGVQQPINATVPAAFALGWAPTLVTNFQIDGIGSGSNLVYLDNLKISRW